MMFKATLVRAILSCCKTQTRRLKFNSQVGDRIWVKETFQTGEYAQNEPMGYVYRATDPDWETQDGWKWKPSIFMPRKASRITLEVTALRQEPLQDISNEDALAEGVRLTPEGGLRLPWEEYANLWDSLLKKNDPNRWENNPTVHVITFRKL